MATTGELNTDQLTKMASDIQEIKEVLIGTMQRPGGLLQEHKQFQENLMDHENRIIVLEEACQKRETRLKEQERLMEDLLKAKASLSTKLWDILKGPIGHGITLILGILAAKMIAI